MDGVMGLSPDAIVDAAEGRNVATACEQLAEMARKAGKDSRPSFGQDVLKVRQCSMYQCNYAARMYNAVTRSYPT